MRTNFEPGRAFANELDYQRQLDAWCERANQRIHRTLRCRALDRLAEGTEADAAAARQAAQLHRQFVLRVPHQPYLRFDRNDYSLDPRLAGRRDEVRISQRGLTAIALDTGELAGRHRRRFARHLIFTDPAHQRELERLRGVRGRGPDVEVELRPLARHGALMNRVPRAPESHPGGRRFESG
jgi:Mu transposase-like protein